MDVYNYTQGATNFICTKCFEQQHIPLIGVKVVPTIEDLILENVKTL